MSFRRIAPWVGIALLVTVLVMIIGTRTLNERAKDRAVEQCVDAVQATETVEPYARGRRIADACGALYAEGGCRHAYSRAWAKHTSPVDRIKIASEGCRDAYCPRLPMPKPALCDEAQITLITTGTTWRDFVRVVLTRDLGAVRADRVFAAMDARSRNAANSERQQ
jgi:hypothetical protein